MTCEPSSLYLLCLAVLTTVVFEAEPPSGERRAAHAVAGVC